MVSRYHRSTIKTFFKTNIFVGAIKRIWCLNTIFARINLDDLLDQHVFPLQVDRIDLCFVFTLPLAYKAHVERSI